MKSIYTLFLCSFLLTNNGIAQTIIMSGTTLTNQCSGTYYDPGGTGKYPNNTDITQTISPSTGNALNITFTNFKLEDGGFQYDYLEIYDGNSIASPLLGKFSGTTIPGPFTSTASDGSLTFKFHSDINTNFLGWVATFSCIPINTITTGTITPLSYCAGVASATVSVPYTATGTFNAGNTFTAQLSNASGSFASPTNIGSGTSPISASIPAGTAAGSGYRIRVVSSNPAVTGTDNGTDITINNPAAPTGSSPQGFCSASNPTVAGLSATGSGIQWYAASSGGTALAGTTPLVNGTHYYASQTVSGCEGSARLDVTANITTTPGAPTGNTTPAFCAINNPTVANLSATGSGIQWYAASSGGLALAGTTALVNGTHYYASQTQSGCESINRLDVTVTINNPAAPTANTPQTFCASNNPTVADLTTLTGTNIKWYAGSTGGTALANGVALTDNTHYFASLTDVNGCESINRVDVLVQLTNTPPTGTSPQNFCATANPTIANIAVTGTNINWYNAATGGSPLATSTPLASGTYYASQTLGGCESKTRLAITVTIGNPAAPTGAAAQSFCSINNPTVNSLVASGSNIKWYLTSSGGIALTGTTALAIGTNHYFASQTDANGCEGLSRFDVTVTVNDPAAPSGSANQAFCAINNPTVANLSATGSGIQWYNASSGGLALAGTTALVNGTHYYASQTDVNGCESINRLDVTVTINNPAAPTGPATQSFCFIDGKKVSDLSVTGDPGSSITWYNAATGGSVVPASTLLVDNTHYFASQTVGGCEGTARLDVLVNVSNPAAPTGSATQFFCSDASHTVADLSATGTAIQWYATPTGGSPLSGSTVLVNGNSYYASQIVAGCESASRLQVTVTINQAVSITSQPNPLQTKCSSFPVSFTVVASGDIGGYQWYKDGNPIAGATSATYSIASVAVSDAGIYTVHITGVGACAAGITSNNAQLIVNEDIVINTQPVASQNLCENSTATISVVASGTGLTYQWRKNGSVISDGGTISGTQTATLQITNLTAADAGNYDVIINSVSGACVQKFSNVSALTVKPLPVGTATVTPASQIICSNTAPSIALSSSLSGTTYSWTVVQSGVTGASNGSGNPIAQVLTATGTVAGTAAYTITPTANGCDGAVIPVTITVNPIATATATPASQPICSGSNISTIALTGTVSGTTFNWTRDNLAVTGIAASGTGDISGSLTNSTPNPIVVTFTITPTANSCAGNPTTATVTVNPTPLLSTTLTPAGICNNATFNYVPASATTGATFSWTRAAVAGISNAAVITPVAGSISEALNNTTSAPINVIYVYTISANGCTHSQNVVVSVNPTATVTAIANQSICSEDVFSTVTVSGPVSGATYNWSWTATSSVTTTLPTSGTGNIASTTIKNNTNIDVDLNFTVTPIINGCSGTPSTFKITVKAKPTISVSPVSQNVCYTTTSNITPISITNPNNVAGTTFNWTRDNPAGLSTTLPTNGTGNVPAVIMTNTGASTITVNFTLTATKNGCSSTTTASVTLYSQLQASVVTDNQTVCILANPAALNGTTPTGGKGTYNYKWQSSTDGINFTDIAGAGTTGLTYQPPTTGIFTNNTYYRLKITDDCVTIFSNSVYIEVVSNVGFTFDLNSNLPNGNNPVCAGTIFTPDISSFHFANSAVRYTWSADPAYISPATGGPVGTTSGVTFFIFRTSSATIGPLTTANNTNAPVTTTISITPSVYHYDNPPTLGTYICSVSPQFISVTINPTPTVNATSDKVVCSGDNVPATVFTGNVTASGISYSWTRTAGNIGLAPTSGTNSVPTFTATNATTAPITVTFTVTPNFTNGGTTCTGVSKTFTITVNPTPVLDAVSNQTVCNGSPTTAVNFTANTTPAGNNTFSWTNNTPSIGLAASGTGNIPSFTATNNGATPVTATITVTPSYNSVTNCPGTAKQFTITVDPTPTASISAVASTVCYNTATSINFTGTANTTLIYTVNGGPNQTINLNASGTASISTGNLTTATTYTLVSIAFQSAPGCSTNISGQSVTVNVNPVATATISAGVSPICKGQSSSITITGTPNTIVTYNPGGATVALNAGGTATVSVSPIATTTYTLVSIAYASAPTCSQNLSAVPGATITVSPDASAGTISGSPTNICINGTTTYSSNGDAGGAWSSSNTAIATVNSITGVVTGVSAGMANIIYTVTSGCNAPKSASKSVTINPDANAGTITGPASLCYPTNVQYFTSGQSGGVWASSNTAIATVDAASGIVTAFGSGTTDITYTINSGCNAPKTATKTVTINPNAITVGAISGPIQLCNATNNVGYSISPIASTTNYTWTLPAGWSFVSGQGTPSIVVNSTATGGTIFVTATNPCSTSSPSNLAVSVSTTGQWLGISADWNNAGNWCGGIPTSTSNVTIPAGTPNNPVISNATAMAQNITINPGALLTITGQVLQISGSITSTNAINATAGSIELNGTSAQNISGDYFVNKTINNLTLSNNANVTGNDTLKIAGQLGFSAATSGKTFNAGTKNVSLLSSFAATANVAELKNSNSISGSNFTVERYINTGTTNGTHGKSWQLLATPANGQTINQAWQEGQTNNVVGKAGYGTQITSPNYTGSNGFDANTAGPSLKTYNSSSNTYTGVTSTNIPLSNPLGYYMFIRGDRSVTAANGNPSNATKLRSTGTLNTGTQPTITILANKFGTVGNPYASPLDLWKMHENGGFVNTTNDLYLWNPSLGGSYGAGGFVTLTWIDVSRGYKLNAFGSTNYPNPYVSTIQSGQAFFVKSNGVGTTNVIFSENKKATSDSIRNINGIIQPTEMLTATLSSKDNNGSPVNLDGAIAIFGEQYSNNVDWNDGLKILNSSNNVSFVRNGASLVVERRQTPEATDTLHISLKNTNQSLAYHWQISTENLDDVPGRMAYLWDRYLNTKTSLNLNGNTDVDFAITGAAASSAADRFKIVFDVVKPLPVTITTVKATRNQDKSITVSWKVANEINMEHYSIERSSDAKTFTSIGIKSTGSGNGIGNYDYGDTNPLSADNYYRINALSKDGQVQYSNIVKVNALTSLGSITVYPNPVQNKEVNMVFVNEPAGTYQLELTNKLGQAVYTGKVTISAVKEQRKVSLVYVTAAGVYHLNIKGPNGKIHTLELVIEL